MLIFSVFFFILCLHKQIRKFAYDMRRIRIDIARNTAGSC